MDEQQNQAKTTTTTTTTKKYRIERDGDRPLRFNGVKIGEGESGSGGTSGYECDWNRGVKVSIYRTTGGNYIVRRYYWSQWQGEEDSSEAVLCHSPAELLAALRDDDGTIRRAEAEALSAAEDEDEGIATIAVEQVE